MDYNSNAIEIIPDSSGPETWAAGAAGAAQSDQATWATEDDYRAWNAEPNLVSSSNPAPDRQYQSRSRAGSEQPPSKKARGSSQVEGSGMSKSRAIGKMFFKTKLCCKFRMGTCPYVTNCNFAHGMEELRKPPPNWQEILAAQDEGSERLELREENQIPIATSSNVGGDGQRSLKGRHCKKFYTEEGCPYGDMCTFLHDEQSKGRESVAISLSPTVGGGGSNGVMSQKPSNWKTRICNKWEMTGYCPFGSKCHFAHGAAELLRYGGGTIGMEAGDASPTAPDLKQANISAKASSKNAVASATSIPHADAYHFGVLLQRSTIANQKQGQEQRPLQKWKGPDKISRIYGDWIDENE